MNILIRQEEVTDYTQIAIINYEAFHHWKNDNPFVKEPLLVAGLRHNSLFDPELSLVAELNDEIIGHALFSPFLFTFSGEEVMGTILGPISVKPEYQNLGVGSQLIHAGLKLLKEKGYSLSLLCGHPDYYPKFGYKKSMFSFSGSKLSLTGQSHDIDNIKERPVDSKDIPWLNRMWSTIHEDDSIAIHPGKTIIDWANHGSPCRSSMILKNDEIIAYVRYKVSLDLEVKELLAHRNELSNVLNFLNNKYKEISRDILSINLSFEYLNEQLEDREYLTLENISETCDAFMIIPLDDCGCVSEYCMNIEEKLISPGNISLPNVYDIEE